jgi:CheY-like chemotaxis protein
MKIEICCPSCNKGYLLDEKALGGEFFCPACSTRITLAGQAESPMIETDVPEPAAAPAVSQAPPGAVAVGAQVTTVQAAPAVSARQEVVCPRCNLHFSPRGKAAANDPRPRPMVLVIEDVGYFQEVAQDALSADCEVRLASTGAEARQVMSQTHVDLVVLDPNLNDSDEGPQLLQEMRSMPFPVLIYTARDESEMYGEEWDELRQQGADDIVIKGMNAAESLKRKVGTLLGRSLDDEDDIE